MEEPEELIFQLRVTVSDYDGTPEEVAAILNEAIDDMEQVLDSHDLGAAVRVIKQELD